MVETTNIDLDELKWAIRLREMEKQKLTHSNNNITLLSIRVRPETKRKFQQMFYELKAGGYITTQEQLVKAFIRIYETKKHVLLRTIQREFH